MSTLLLSSWSREVQSVPANYVFPKDKRPGGDIEVPVCKDLPVIDLSQLDGIDHRVKIVQQIMKANRDFGMFQVQPLELCLFLDQNIVIPYIIQNLII